MWECEGCVRKALYQSVLVSKWPELNWAWDFGYGMGVLGFWFLSRIGSES